jgi:hypothetical protein
MKIPEQNNNTTQTKSFLQKRKIKVLQQILNIMEGKKFFDHIYAFFLSLYYNVLLSD